VPLARPLTWLVASLHAGFMALEMVLWDTPAGHAVFNMRPEQAAATAVLAQNQGLYNGLLSAGIVWSLRRRDRDATVALLIAVVIAGAFGAATASPTILFVQALPAALALAAWRREGEVA
jgi:putative membrane protein